MEKRLYVILTIVLLAFLLAPALAYADEVQTALTGSASYEENDGTIKSCTDEYLFLICDSSGTPVSGGGFANDGTLQTTPFETEAGTYYLVLKNADGSDLPSYAWYEIEIESTNTDLGDFTFERIDTVTLAIKKDGTLWADNQLTSTFALKRNDGGIPGEYRTNETGSTVHFYKVFDGTYHLYAGSLDTGITVVIQGADSPFVQPQTIQIDYYSISFETVAVGIDSGVQISAVYDSMPLVSGSVVLGGKNLVLTVIPPDARAYSYTWRGEATLGQTTPSITLSTLSQRVDAVCVVELEGYPGDSPAEPLEENTLPRTSDTSALILPVAAIMATAAVMILRRKP